jgi:putative DNA methylase
VASRAAVLASVLPASADHEQFLHALGIHGDPANARRQIDVARRTGVRVDDPYGYERAFNYNLTADERHWIVATHDMKVPIVLDPTAGGGSIPFEAARLGLSVLTNDLNPVAALIERATIEYPIQHGTAVLEGFERLGAAFRARLEDRLAALFPQPGAPDCLDATYLWARTIRCPYCDGLIPLAPNWKLARDGTGALLRSHLGGGRHSEGRVCTFEIVHNTREQSSGTVADGDATCPFSDCGRVVDGDEVKRQAQAGDMGEQLFAVVCKRRIETRTKGGSRGRDKWERGYRAPCPEDNNSATIVERLAEKTPEWEALNFIPNETIWSNGRGSRVNDPGLYGANLWRDLFSPRQLLGHATGVEVFRELLVEREASGTLDEATSAAFVYLALALDKMLNYNSRMSVWMATREVVANTFNRHDFAFCWSHAEMAPLIAGLGYDWAIAQMAKCIRELVELSRPDSAPSTDLLTPTASTSLAASVTITCKPGDALDHIANGSVDIVVMDPPYYDNVNYSELSDFFYVWLKRTAGQVVPDLFTRYVTDKESEAIANPALFAGQKGAKMLAGRDYQERMARIFEECRRVLRSNGIMTLMFTHKATGAWDALTKGLMQAGFIITASWPINTEAESSLNIKDKSAANSTIFLVCRPRAVPSRDAEASYWEDVEPFVAAAVRGRVQEFQEAGITGVDLYLASFGPALEEFSRHWPLNEDEWDPYSVTPEDALDAARREVKRWRLEQLTHMKANEELDALTSFFVLAWDAFHAAVFPYDEASRLARAVGVDLDTQVVGVLCEKKGSDLIIWDSGRRAAKGALGAPDGRRGMIDAVHHAAHMGRSRTLGAARELLVKAGVDGEPAFLTALEAVLEVLPVSKAFSGIELEGDLASASSDSEALENLRKLAFADQVDEPKQLEQLELWQETAAG